MTTRQPRMVFVFVANLLDKWISLNQGRVEIPCSISSCQVEIPYSIATMWIHFGMLSYICKITGLFCCEHQVSVFLPFLFCCVVRRGSFNQRNLNLEPMLCYVMYSCYVFFIYDILLDFTLCFPEPYSTLYFYFDHYRK